MALSKKDKDVLFDVEQRLDKAIDFVKKSDLEIIKKSGLGCMLEDRFMRGDVQYCRLTKFVGSDLAELLNAKERIELLRTKIR